MTAGRIDDAHRAAKRPVTGARAPRCGAGASISTAARRSPRKVFAGIECAYFRRMLRGIRVAGLIIWAGSMAACTSTGGSPIPTDAVDGRQVFFTQCYGCHTLGAAGTPIAPDLSHIGARLSRDEIERRLRDPRTHKQAARMPKLDLSEAEIGALATYLSELR